MSRRPPTALAAPVLVLALAAALAAQSPGIESVEPAEGTEGTEFIVSGTNFGTKPPKLFLTVDGAKAPRTNLKVLGFVEPDDEGDETQQLRVLVKRAVAGEYQIAINAKGKVPVVSDVGFSILPPTITSVAPFFPGGPGAFAIDLENATSKGAKVRFSSRKAKLLSLTPTGPTSSRAIVQRPDLPDGLWDVTFATRVGQDVAHQAVQITGSSVTSLGPRQVQWSAEGPSLRSRRGNQTGQLFNGQLHFSGKTKSFGDLKIAVAELPGSALTNFTGPTVFSGFQGRLLFVLELPGELPTVYRSPTSSGPMQHSIFLNHVDEKRVAGSFFGTLPKLTTDGPGPDEIFIEGSFVFAVPEPNPQP